MVQGLATKGIGIDWLHIENGQI